jgi:hypothetical protein
MSWRPSDVGKKCKTTSGKRGTVKWVGEGKFAPGTWIGIELNTPDGKHDGEVKGHRYFKCKSKHGVMLKPSQVKKIATKAKPGTKPTAKSGTKARTKKTSATGLKTTKKPASVRKKAGFSTAVTKAKRNAAAKRGTTGTRTPIRKKSTPKKKPKGASALAAKRKALAAAKRGKKSGDKKTPKTPRKSADRGKREADANELLRQKIIASFSILFFLQQVIKILNVQSLCLIDYHANNDSEKVKAAFNFLFY